MPNDLDEASEVMLLVELDRCKTELAGVEAEFGQIISAQNINSKAARETAERMLRAAARLEAITSAFHSKPSARSH